MTVFLNRRALMKRAAAAAALAALDTKVNAAGQEQSRVSLLIEKERKAGKLPGLGAAVVSSKGIQDVAVSGVRVWPSGAAIRPGDRWHLGSCTKAFTSTLVARLVDRGSLRWDSTIAEVLPGEMDAAWRTVPLLWLLCHRSGASMNFDQELWERMVAQAGPLIDQRRYFVREGLKKPPEAEPGSQTIYSNAGYMVAGAMCEAVTGTSWEQLIRQEIFDQLGMRSSGFGPPGPNEPRGHNRSTNGEWTPAPSDTSADNPAAAGPAGTINCALGDWAKFVSAHLRGFRGEDSYLSRSSWQRLHSPGGMDWEYAPGWKVNRPPSGSNFVLQHLGSNGYWVAQATLFPAKDRAVLIVTNVADDAAEPVFGRILSELGGQ